MLIIPKSSSAGRTGENKALGHLMGTEGQLRTKGTGKREVHFLAGALPAKSVMLWVLALVSCILVSPT